MLLQESERYAYEWQRCLESALEVCVCLCPVSDLIPGRDLIVRATANVLE